MGLESTATYIDSLVVTNPEGGDSWTTADNHLRLIKAALKRTFPNVAGEVSVSYVTLNNAAAPREALSLSFNFAPVRFGGLLRMGRVVTPPTITEAQTGIGNSQTGVLVVDYSFTGIESCSVIRISSDAGYFLCGLAAPGDGRVVYIENVGAHAMNFINEAGPTPSAHQILIGGGQLFTPLPADTAAGLYYDGDSSRWRLFMRPT